MLKLYFKIFLILCVFLFKFSSSLKQNEERHEEILDPEEKYFLAWKYDEENEEIIFEIEVETLGWVGLGLSTNGRMNGADIIIGGFDHFDNGTEFLYFEDRHGVGNIEPVKDIENNWDFIKGWELNGKTHLEVKRKLITCDLKEDLQISEDLVHIIWAYGETDKIEKHIAKGQQQFNLLDKPNPPVDTEMYERFPIILKHPEVLNETLYWITFHKIDIFENGQKYLVGFDPSPIMSSNKSEKHTHHLVIGRCVTPTSEMADEIFGPYIGHDGWKAGDPDIPGGGYCSSYLYTWAKGGKMLLFPDHLGFTMGHHKNEYIYIEVHYDNPELIDNLSFETEFHIFFADKKNGEERDEAGLFGMGILENPSHFIPPATSQFVSNGHCSSACTSQHFPEEGVKVFNIMLHSHLAGRKMVVRHFRNGKELPWANYDGNYDFDYQQSRNLRHDLLVLPGDHLTVECTFDTTNRNYPTLSGEGTFEEMCQAYFWYYPRRNLLLCGSMYLDQEGLFSEFGIEDFHPSKEKIDYYNPVVKEPPHLAGQRLFQVLNETNWTESLKKQVEKWHYNDDHEDWCLGGNDISRSRFSYWKKLLYRKGEIRDKIVTNYPKYEKKYELPNICSSAYLLYVEKTFIFMIIFKIFYF